MCRHFRRSVAAQLGYCSLDRQRLPLHGDEIRACWEAAAAAPEVAPTPIRAPVDYGPVRTPVRRIEFVEVRGAVGTEVHEAAVVAATTVKDPWRARPKKLVDSPPGASVEAPIASTPVDAGWSLWSDAEL